MTGRQPARLLALANSTAIEFAQAQPAAEGDPQVVLEAYADLSIARILDDFF